MSVDNRLSRRAFLRAALGAGLGAGAVARSLRVGAQHNALNASTKPGRVGIVGGGLAGLTVAYLLNKSGVDCEILEGSERLGGRVWTQSGFNAENMFAEMGAEYVAARDTSVLALARELAVGVQELTVGAGENAYFIEGTLHSEKEASAALKGFSTRLIKARAEGSAKWDARSVRAFLESAKADSDAWLLQAIDIAYRNRSGLTTEGQSAMNLLSRLEVDGNRLHLFGKGDRFARIRGGSMELLNALFTRIEGKVPLLLGQKLVAIKQKSNSVQLGFNGGGGQTSEKIYARVVLTLPFSTLREVAGLKALGLSAGKLRLIQDLGYGAHLKTIYSFTEKPWLKRAALRDAQASIVANGLVPLAWDSSFGQVGKMAVLSTLRMGLPATEVPLKEEMERMFPGSDAAFDPTSRATADWVRPPWSRGSYACAKPGQFRARAASAGLAELGGRLHFAGEHASGESPASMNGAVESATRVVAALLKR